MGHLGRIQISGQPGASERLPPALTDPGLIWKINAWKRPEKSSFPFLIRVFPPSATPKPFQRDETLVIPFPEGADCIEASGLVPSCCHSS